MAIKYFELLMDMDKNLSMKKVEEVNKKIKTLESRGISSKWIECNIELLM